MKNRAVIRLKPVDPGAPKFSATIEADDAETFVKCLASVLHAMADNKGTLALLERMEDDERRTLFRRVIELTTGEVVAVDDTKDAGGSSEPEEGGGR